MRLALLMLVLSGCQKVERIETAPPGAPGGCKLELSVQNGIPVVSTRNAADDGFEPRAMVIDGIWVVAK